MKAAATVILLLLAVQTAAIVDTVASIGRPSEQASFQPFTRCNDLGDAGDLMWDGSRIVSRSGIYYATVEVTKLVYSGGIPSEIGLKTPFSVAGVTFSSPTPESFANITITLGVLYINVTFADGRQQKLSAIVFLPPIKDGTPQGCALLVNHEDQQAGFVVVFTPSSEPLDNAALRYETLGKVFQCRIYVIVRVSTTATQSLCTVVAESSLMVHLTDESRRPIPNATILLKGTYVCPPSDNRLNQSGITDLNGDVWFSIIPDAKYNVTVVLPENLQGRTIIVTQISAPGPTLRTTVNITCTPSVGQCRTAAPTQTTTTTTSTAPSGPVPGFPPESIITGLALSVALIFFRARRFRGSSEASHVK